MKSVESILSSNEPTYRKIDTLCYLAGHYYQLSMNNEFCYPYDFYKWSKGYKAAAIDLMEQVNEEARRNFLRLDNS